MPRQATLICTRHLRFFLSKETPRKRDLKAPSAEPEGPAGGAGARGGAGPCSRSACWPSRRRPGGGGAEEEEACAARAAAASVAAAAAAAAAAAGVGGVMPPPLASWALVVISSRREGERPRGRRKKKKVERGGKKVAVGKPVVVRRERGEQRLFDGWGRAIRVRERTVFDRLFLSRAASVRSTISGLGSTCAGDEQGGHQRRSICVIFFLSRPPRRRKMPAGLSSG